METVLKKGEVSEGEKERIYHKVIYSRPSKQKPRRLIPAVSILTCLLLLLILGSNSFYDYYWNKKESRKWKILMQPNNL